MNRTILVAIVISAVAVGAVAWSITKEDPVSVTLTSVQRGTVRSTVANTRAGTVSTCNRARMSPILGGQIATLPVSEGEEVEAGQVLLELWNKDVRAQLLLVQKERDTAVARADEVCTASTVANREAERIDRLYDLKLISEERADAVLGASQAKEAACRAMRNMIEVSEARIDLTKAKLEQTILRAPFAGTVAEINGEVGEIVIPSPVGVATLPAVDLIDTSCTFVTAPIDEVDAPDIRSGMKAEITLDAYPGEVFPATVRRVASYVLDREKQARTVDIEVEFDQSSSNLLPGYSADVEVVLNVKENVLFVPTQVILNNDHVMILSVDGILEERSVKTGIRNWQVTEIINGLDENDRIVLSIAREGVVAGALAVADDSRP